MLVSALKHSRLQNPRPLTKLASNSHRSDLKHSVLIHLEAAHGVFS